MTLARVRAGAMIWLVRGASAQSKVQMRPYPKVIWILLNNEVDRWKEIEKGGQDGRERSSTIHGSSGVPVLLLLPGLLRGGDPGVILYPLGGCRCCPYNLGHICMSTCLLPHSLPQWEFLVWIR